MNDYRITMLACTETIIAEVGLKTMTQNDIALTYASAITSEARKKDKPDWPAIHTAILGRWKMSGLERIKKRAFDILARNPAGLKALKEAGDG